MSKIIQIKNDCLTVSISTLGAELSSIKGNGGTEFLWEGDKAVWGGKAPVLFPICGAVKNNTYTFNGTEYNIPKHGFTKTSEFEGENLSHSKALFTLKSSADTLSVYPFEFILNITYELIKNELKITYCVENPGKEEMYFSIGAHESYSCPEGIEEYCMEFEEPLTLDAYPVVGTCISNKTVRIGENIKTLPLKYEYFEVDALIFKDVDFSKASLVHTKSSKKSSVVFDGFNNFLIWTKPDAKFICLEPWCGVLEIDGTTSDLVNKENIIKLPANNRFTLTHSITYEE